MGAAALAMACVILFFCLGAGRRILGAAAEQVNPLSRLAASGGLGLALLAYWVFLVGLAQLLYLPALIVGIAGIAALGGRALRGVCYDVREAFGRPQGVAGWAIALALAVCLLWPLCNALRPPHDWDAISYHLPIPQHYLATHGIRYIAYDHHANFPLTMEMLYTLGLGLGNDRLPALFHLATHVLCLLAIAGLCEGEKKPREAGSKRRGGAKSFKHTPALGALLFASIPAAAWEAGTAYVDVALALYLALAVTALVHWWPRPAELHWAALCGAFCGVAMGIKHTGGIALIFALLCLGAKALAERKALWRPGAWLVAVALLVGGPWYVRSYVYTGNPVYPFFFGGRGWPEEGTEHYRAEHKSHGLYFIAQRVAEGAYRPTRLAAPGREEPAARSLHERATEAIFKRGVPPAPASWALAAYYLAMDPRPFWEARSLCAVLGPAFLGLLPLLLFLRPVSRGAKVALCAGLVWFVTWTHLSQLLRYLLPALALCAPAAAEAAALAFARRPLVAQFAKVAVAAMLALPVYICALLLASTLLAPADDDAYLALQLESYPVIKWANANLPPTAKIATYGEPRCYYLKIPYFWADPVHNLIINYAKLADAEDLLEAYRRVGVTHLLINRTWLKLGASPQQRRVEQMWRELLEEGKLRIVREAAGGDVLLVEVAPERGERGR